MPEEHRAGAQEAPARAQAHCRALASSALPALGESGSPLTAPTRRHWKSFRTSSQLCMPPLRVDPTRARRRRHRQPRRQVGASIIVVLVTSFPVMNPTLLARPALQALKTGWAVEAPERCNPAQGVPGPLLEHGLHLRTLSLLPRSPEVETPEFLRRTPQGLAPQPGELALRGRGLWKEPYRAREHQALATAAGATGWA